MELKPDIIKDNLLRILNIANLENSESDGSALALAILGITEKDFILGYIIRPNHPTVKGIADITIKIIRNQQKILLVECKKNPQATMQCTGLFNNLTLIDTVIGRVRNM